MLLVCQQAIVFRVRSNPEPDNLVSVPHTERSISESYAGREDGLRGMDLLEVQTRMVRVSYESMVRFTRLALNVFWERLKGLPEPWSSSRSHSFSGSSSLVLPSRWSLRASSANAER